MKRINEIVVVEGKTDSQLLKELYDVDTIETHGLGLDEKTLELIKEASKTRGVIVLTDPDYPGLKIRNQVEKYVQNCKHAFVDRKDAIGRKKLGIAEANKEADKKRKEEVEVRNDADSLIFNTEKALTDLGDKASSEDKDKATKAMDELKEALKGTDIDDIKKYINNSIMKH